MALFWRSSFGVLTAVLAGVVALGVCAVGVQVFRSTHPPLDPGKPFDFAAIQVSVEAVRFEAADGVDLAGWFLTGDPGSPALLLCHDWGRSKASLTQLALDLNDEGFHVLALDFRGHGASERRGSTFGLREKRDVLGALDWLKSRGFEGKRVGVYGVGMGAYAALLAAEGRQRIGVFVLDSPYPDATEPLVERVYAEWAIAEDWLGFLPRTLFQAGGGGHGPSSDALFERFVGRDVLLLASDGDAATAERLKRLVEAIPRQPDHDGSLLILPATHGEGLFGEDRGAYHRRVSRFFADRLPKRS